MRGSPAGVRAVSGDLTGLAVPTNTPDHQPAPIGISERARSQLLQRARFSAIKQVRGAALLTIHPAGERVD
jgi:hypothetical protein